MKTLVVVAHPGMEGSTVNKRWLEELKKYPEQITVHELYKKYPDEKLNVQWEQELIETHDQVILQFPVYWFNCPPLLKKNGWMRSYCTDGLMVRVEISLRIRRLLVRFLQELP